MRATQVDNKGSIHLVANEIFADNVERGVLASVPGTHASAQAVCPNFEPVVVGNAFTCRLSHAGPYTQARVTIVDGDWGLSPEHLLIGAPVPATGAGRARQDCRSRRSP